MENKFDTQLLIEGHDLDEDEIHDYILEHFKGDCLLAVGDEDVKAALRYCIEHQTADAERS